MWRSDGTATGTKKAFQKTNNDLHIHRGIEMFGEGSRSRDKFGVMGNVIYVSGNINDLNVHIPKGGFRVPAGTNAYSEGFNQAAAVSDVDTPPYGNLTVTLSVDQGVIVIKGEDTGGSHMAGSYGGMRNLSFLLAISNNDETEMNYLFNALLVQGHVVEIVTTGEAAVQAVQLKAATAARVQAQLLSAGAESIPASAVQQSLQYDTILMAQGFTRLPYNDSTDGLEATRLIRIYEMLKNSTRIPIYIISNANEVGLPDLEDQSGRAGAEGLLLLPVVDYTTVGDETTLVDTGIYPNNVQ